MVRTHMVRVEHDVWKEYKKAVSDSDFDAGDLINWILASVKEDKEIGDWIKDLEDSVEKSEPQDEDESEDEDEDEEEEEEEE